MGTSRKFKKKSRKRFFSKNRRSKMRNKKPRHLRKNTKKRGRMMRGGGNCDLCTADNMSRSPGLIDMCKACVSDSSLDEKEKSRVKHEIAAAAVAAERAAVEKEVAVAKVVSAARARLEKAVEVRAAAAARARATAGLVALGADEGAEWVKEAILAKEYARQEEEAARVATQVAATEVAAAREAMKEAAESAAAARRAAEGGESINELLERNNWYELNGLWYNQKFSSSDQGFERNQAIEKLLSN